MTDEAFYGPEWDLANIAANTFWGDAFLTDLIELAETGFGTPVGVLTNGMVVVGTVATSGEIAEELDRQRRVSTKAADKPDGLSAEEWAERMEDWANVNTRLYESAVRERDEVEEKLQAADQFEWDYSTQPKGLPREALETRLRTTLTLTNVQIFAPGQVGLLKPPVLRLALRQIAGWWPIRVNEEGRASFQLFTTDDD